MKDIYFTNKIYVPRVSSKLDKYPIPEFHTKMV